MWLMRALSPHSDDAAPTRNSRRMAGIIACMAIFQIYLGALVAGLDAGPVSYTHLDVYKRQGWMVASRKALGAGR